MADGADRVGIVPDAQAYYAAGYWRAGGFWTSIAEVAARSGTRRAFIAGGRQATFDEIGTHAARLGSGLAARGIGPGDAVVIHASNSIEAAEAILACAHAGAVATPVPPMYSAAQIASIARSAGARALLTLAMPEQTARALEGAAQVETLATVVARADPGGARGVSWQELLAHAPDREPARTSPDELALLVYSSGTTGEPKGVMHSWNTVRYAIEQRSRLHGVTGADTCLVVSQFGFVGGTVFGLLAGLLNGTTSVLMSKWDPDEAVQAIATHGVSYAHLMPTHVHDVLACGSLDRTDVSSLWRGAMGGLAPEQRREVVRRLCPCPLPAYGMSECLGHATVAWNDGEARRLTRDGKPYPGTEIVVADEAGDPLPSDQAGEIRVRGPSRFLGYLGAPALTRQTITGDGFFRTGDVGSLDADGYLTFVSRAKDVVRRGGVTIVPAEVEAVLMTHPEIAAIAIVGLPDERLGERVCACVVTRTQRALPLEALTRYLEERGVARYLWPERAVAFADFPRTPSLKVQRRALVEEIRRRDRGD